MLVEIHCDEFMSYGKPRKPIIFHEGLNTVLGGQSADNSIGKSTFLLIIDYVFGGDTYKYSDAAHKLKNHFIKFAFKFDNQHYYFCRDIVDSEEVSVCDKNYNIQKTIPLQEFKDFLFSKYNINLPHVTFRDVVGRYFRIYGKDNHSEKKPLHSTSSEPAEKAITALEKLFNVFDRIQEYKTVESMKKDKFATFKKARKFELLPFSITTKRQYKENEKEIARLREALVNLTEQIDKDLSHDDLVHAEEASAIKAEITSIKRQRSRLLSQLKVVTKNLSGERVISESDIVELAQFFPEADIRKIKDINRFHGKMQQILSDEMTEEAERLRVLIESTEIEISRLEDDLRKLGIPANLSKRFLENYSEIERKINMLEAQNSAYINSTNLKEEVKIASENLRIAQEKELRFIESEINEQMVRFNDFIYDETRKAPVIDLDNGKRYEFYTPDDTGTGTSFKSLIIFDLSILKLTPLPAIAHDSLIFKNIGDAPIDKIMELYMQSKKQIFISLDKDGAYSEKTRSILNKTAVLHLNEGGDELFGRSWNKKDSTQGGL
ncbi:DUF2326 domain-containing protein [Garciella nitratireducens]|jgi:hypothetical protein|uniref:DUF2326 domain-containing protein n=1 Tax=Eubacteriales TaxID=186802 RepID=UPI001BD335F5|nr:DUF2326 domain-containing protein [Garciella nitratireducens]MCH3955279.1 DUF2326 domain-containing protein [Eubacterium sp.]MCI2190559.1 DUF2326 domain-containing protein [Lactococcus lactis]HIT93117.1 DUF2326 domain-containing protein [Candidatus Stercorousia faecigallinarum]